MFCTERHHWGRGGGAALFNNFSPHSKDKYISGSRWHGQRKVAAERCPTHIPFHQESVWSFCTRAIRSDRPPGAQLIGRRRGATVVLRILHFLKLQQPKLAQHQLFSRATRKDEIDHHYDNREQLRLGNSNGK